MMYKLRKKIAKAKAACKAYDNIRQYTHNFGDFVFYKSMNNRSSFLENLAADKTKILAEKMAMEEEHRRTKRKISTLPYTETTNMYLILPSNAEPQKAENSKIIAREQSNKIKRKEKKSDSNQSQ